MPTIVKFGNLKIQIFADDHNPPHFHVVTPDGEALVAIDTLEIIVGDIDRRSYEAAREWAARNTEVLASEWKRLNER